MGPYLYDGDPVFYFQGAVNILSSGRYVVDGYSPVWPMGYSLAIIPFLLFISSEIAGIMPSLIFSLFSIVLIYYWGKRIFSPAVGFLSALLLSFSEGFLIESVNVSSDTQALFFYLLSVYMLFEGRRGEKGEFSPQISPGLWKIFLSGFFLGLASLTRYSYIIFLILPFIYIFFLNYSSLTKRGMFLDFKHLSYITLIFFGGFIIPLIPQLIYNQNHFGAFYRTGYSQVGGGFPDILKVAVPNLFRFFYRITFSWDFFSPFLFVFFLLSLTISIRRKSYSLILLLLLLFSLGILPFIFYSISPMKPRFLMVVLPWFLIFGSSGIMEVSESIQERIFPFLKSRLYRAVLLTLFLSLLFAPFAAQSLLHALQMREENRLVKESFSWIRENSDSEDIILSIPRYVGHFLFYKRTRQDVWAAKYYSERVVYSLDEDLAFLYRMEENRSIYVVLNEFWMTENNLLTENYDLVISNWERLRSEFDISLVKSMKAGKEPYVLKKLLTYSFYPLNYQMVRHNLLIYKIKM